jgi:hypothetical protein
MAESTPHFAPIVVLLFLVAVLATGASVLVLLVGAVRRSKLIAKIGGGGALLVTVCYLLLLCSVSLASNEKVVPPGGWKYFCELDCHIGYSVSGVQATGTLGPEMKQTSAQGQFVVVRLKVWFDEHTISPQRGNGSLTPNARRVVLVDSEGNAYSVSAEGEAELARTTGEQESLRRPMRPGESFTTNLVFDVPKNVRGLRLLITEDDPETRLIIGHENSLLHKKIYLDLNPASSITSEISLLAFLQ